MKNIFLYIELFTKTLFYRCSFVLYSETLRYFSEIIFRFPLVSHCSLSAKIPAHMSRDFYVWKKQCHFRELRTVTLRSTVMPFLGIAVFQSPQVPTAILEKKKIQKTIWLLHICQLGAFMIIRRLISG